MRIVIIRAFLSGIVRVAMMRNSAEHNSMERCETFSVETAPLEELVHEEGSSGHVAGFFEQRNKEKEDEDLWKEYEKGADSANDAVDDQALEHGNSREEAADFFPIQLTIVSMPSIAGPAQL